MIAASLFAASPFAPVKTAELDELLERIVFLDSEMAATTIRSIGVGPAYLPFLRHYLAGLLNVRLGDRAGALEHGHSLRRLGGVRTDPGLGRGLAQSIDAASAWSNGDVEGTFRVLAEVPLGPQQLKAALGYAAQGYERFLFGEALSARGEYEAALRWYGSFPEPGGYDLIYLAPSHLRRAEIYERQGDSRRAALHYARFVELWEECDPELRPTVERARERLAELAG
jgi:tetratricopeptide (TPR) repeat protein